MKISFLGLQNLKNQLSGFGGPRKRGVMELHEAHPSVTTDFPREAMRLEGRSSPTPLRKQGRGNGRQVLPQPTMPLSQL